MPDSPIVIKMEFTGADPESVRVALRETMRKNGLVDVPADSIQVEEVPPLMLDPVVGSVVVALIVVSAPLLGHAIEAFKAHGELQLKQRELDLKEQELAQERDLRERELELKAEELRLSQTDALNALTDLLEEGARTHGLTLTHAGWYTSDAKSI